MHDHAQIYPHTHIDIGVHIHKRFTHIHITHIYIHDTHIHIHTHTKQTDIHTYIHTNIAPTNLPRLRLKS